FLLGDKLSVEIDPELITGPFTRVDYFDGIHLLASVSSDFSPYCFAQITFSHRGFWPIRAVAMNGNSVLKEFRPICFIVGSDQQLLNNSVGIFDVVFLQGTDAKAYDLNDSNS